MRGELGQRSAGSGRPGPRPADAPCSPPDTSASLRLYFFIYTTGGNRNLGSTPPPPPPARWTRDNTWVLLVALLAAKSQRSEVLLLPLHLRFHVIKKSFRRNPALPDPQYLLSCKRPHTHSDLVSESSCRACSPSFEVFCPPPV